MPGAKDPVLGCPAKFHYPKASLSLLKLSSKAWLLFQALLRMGEIRVGAQAKGALLFLDLLHSSPSTTSLQEPQVPTEAADPPWNSETLPGLLERTSSPSFLSPFSISCGYVLEGTLLSPRERTGVCLANRQRSRGGGLWKLEKRGRRRDSHLGSLKFLEPLQRRWGGSWRPGPELGGGIGRQFRFSCPPPTSSHKTPFTPPSL